MKSESSECDNPNEYRNLLISLSGDKSDHILWMQCLMTCARRGEGEFSFTLDKCGVPNLKVRVFESLCVLVISAQTDGL